MTVTEPRQRLRADACLNRKRIVAAARDVFVESGADARLDEIARRAGVGNATLYRHFPDRTDLIRAVGIEVLETLTEMAECALAEAPDAYEALRRFVHGAADQRVGALFPGLGQQLVKDEEFYAARDRSMAAMEHLVDTAQQAGLVRPDVAIGDLMFPLTQLTRPLPGTTCQDYSTDTIHRHLELLLDGLRTPQRSALPGSAITLADVQRVCSEPTTTN